MGKAERFAEAATSVGWEVADIVTTSDDTSITVKRGTESIHIAWHKEVWNYPAARYEIDGRARKILNVSAAKKIMGVPADAVKVARPKRQPGTRAPRRVYKRVPFSPEEASDKEVLEAICGHKIHWTNKYTSVEESGVVPINGNHTRLDADDLDHPATRQLTFADALGEGFRTLALSQLTSVSSGAVAITSMPEAPRRGRPKGSKNKK